MDLISADQAPDGIQGILLAAGRGSRFGADKLLHALADGTPLALQSARRMRAALPQMLVVLRPGADRLAECLRREGFACVLAADAELGMGHSVAAGIAASADAAGWVIGLADMPFVRADTIAQVAGALRAGAALAAPQYQGRRGNPVAWSARFREQLLALRGDAGARQLLQAQGAALALLAVDDPGVLQDVDTPADLSPVPPAVSGSKQ